MKMEEMLSKESCNALATARKEAELRVLLQQANQIVKYKQAIAWNHRLSYQDAKDLSNAEILVIPVEDKTGISNYSVIFNLPEIKGREGWDVTLEVPAGKEEIFIGACGWQCKEWTKKLRERHLHVDRVMVVPSDATA